MILIVAVVILSAILALSRRRLGYFNLAIMAGVVLDGAWNNDLSTALTGASLNIPFATLSGIVSLFLILTPAFLVLPKCGKQENWVIGIAGAILSAILTVSLLNVGLSKVFAFDASSLAISQLFNQYAKFIILAGVVLAILSILSFSLKKLDKKP